MLTARQRAGTTLVGARPVVTHSNIGRRPRTRVTTLGAGLVTALVDVLTAVVSSPVLVAGVTLALVRGVGRPPHLVDTVGV